MSEVTDILRPDPDDDWYESVLEEWWLIWDSPMAAYYTSLDVPGLRRLFEYRNTWVKLRDSFHEPTSELLVDGSRGNVVINPVVRYMRDVEDQIAKLEGQYGLTPKSRAQLGIDLNHLELSWQEVQKRRTDKPAVTGSKPKPLPARIVKD